MNRKKTVLALTATLVLLISMVGAVSAAATITPSTDTPVTGEEITFTVGTTLEGLEADISVTGLSFVSNTGLGNASHAITVPGMGTAYTYRVTAEEGGTVSFVLSGVKEATADGQEVDGQTVSWMGTAQRAAEPTPTPSASEQPTESPSTEPTPSQNPDESSAPSPSESSDQTPAPSGNPSPTPTPIPPANTGGSSGGAASGGITGALPAATPVPAEAMRVRPGRILPRREIFLTSGCGSELAPDLRSLLSQPAREFSRTK